MGLAQRAEEERYTLDDVMEWDGPEQMEIIDGEPLMMATPKRLHQAVVGGITRLIGNYLEGKKCRVYPAPFAVRLFEQEGDNPEDVDTVVQPDITLVCDPKKLDDTGCKGAPEMVVEVLSPSTQRYDRIVKLELYQRAGVGEYWIVNPADQTVQVFLLKDGLLRPHESYGRTDIAKVNSLDGCFIELERVFTE